jgi:hypothetical protein
MAMTNDRSQVGYGKPPRHTRFQPGQSGNPSGKRKPTPSLAQRLDQILAEKVSVTEGGTSRKISKEEVFLRQMVAKAISGDKQFGRLLLDYLQRRQDTPDAAATNQTDEFLLGELVQMLGAQGDEP